MTVDAGSRLGPYEVVSPLACVEFSAGSGEIYLQDFPAARHRYPVSAGGGYKPTFAPDGREILYVNDDSDITAAEIRREGGFVLDPPRKLFRVSGCELMDISRDGKRLVLKVPVQNAFTIPVQVIFDWQSEVAAGATR